MQHSIDATQPNTHLASTTDPAQQTLIQPLLTEPLQQIVQQQFNQKEQESGAQGQVKMQGQGEESSSSHQVMHKIRNGHLLDFEANLPSINPMQTNPRVPNLFAGMQSPQVTTLCNCKKSKCLKLYCQCFQAGRKCGEGCKCLGCQNILTNDLNNPPFKPNLTQSIIDGTLPLNVFASEVDRVCNCKKSSCLKKYCECFNAGIYCTSSCKCEECKNMKPGEEQPNSKSPRNAFSVNSEVKPLANGNNAKNEQGFSLKRRSSQVKKEREESEIEEIDQKISEVYKHMSNHKSSQREIAIFLSYWLS